MHVHARQPRALQCCGAQRSAIMTQGGTSAGACEGPTSVQCGGATSARWRMPYAASTHKLDRDAGTAPARHAAYLMPAHLTVLTVQGPCAVIRGLPR